jgi:predicted TIM-barrel fold metal-dependent hydrolase
MSLPDVGIVDLMLGIPDGPKKDWYRFLQPLVRDHESRDEFEFPVEYMFKEVPDDHDEDDNVAFVISQMDRYGIDQAMVGYMTKGETGRALREHPDRFLASVSVDPNRGMDALRAIEKGVEDGAVSVQVFPAGCNPQVPINDKRMYPIYAKCVELDIPVFVCVGVPGPRVPMACQHMELVDEVCWLFPELRFVTRHGCEPWTDLAVKLLLKWPNLYYSTSAFAPKYYPKAIIDYANTRGADKIMYAGYFPMGLSLERIMRELPNVPLKDEVWPKFLRDNARRVLKLDERGAR